jgi:glycosyltransferase involved in cell wall biosynthesis
MAGGAEVHLEENLKRLARAGFDITLLCSNFPGGAPRVEWEGIRILRHGGRFDFNWRVPFLVRRLVQQEHFDLLIEDINKIPFYTPLYQPVPVLAVVPHLFATTVFHEINFVLAMYIYLAEYPVRWMYRRVPFCVISRSTQTDLIERGFARSDIDVIHCGIDQAQYYYDPSVSKSSEPLILYLGRLKKYKSVQHLLHAFARLERRVPRARLVIVGEGDYRAALEQLARQLKVVDKVHFTGFVSLEEKVRYLRQAWVAVCPSLKEGWGLTNIEANACGTPVIAADVPGLRDSVKHDVTGRLYPYGDLVRLESELEAVLKDPSERDRLAAGGRKWAAAFDWDSAAGQMGALIDRCIAEGRKDRSIEA